MTTVRRRLPKGLLLSSALVLLACGDEVKVEDDPGVTSDEAGAQTAADAGSERSSNDAEDAQIGPDAGQKPRDAAAPMSESDGSQPKPANDAGASPDDDASVAPGADAAAPETSACALRAKQECEYQRQCDPVHFALEWDNDITQFCIPKRTAACEKGLTTTDHRAVSEACDTWVRASCDNYRNFYHRVYDSNGKWQYGDPACESTPSVHRGDKAKTDACTNDYECKAGLFCKTANDDYKMHGDANVESVCGKCAPQYAYDDANTPEGFYGDDDVCYRQGQCKADYTCLRVYGTTDDGFISFDFATVSHEDLRHCVKTIQKAKADEDCALDSDVQCQDGLVCLGASEGAVVGTCKPAQAATIPTYVGKDARCGDALCDPRLHLECKPVQKGGSVENRCVQRAVAPIGGYCQNDSKEHVADCSRYARCDTSSGLCVRRNLEDESCFASVTTPGVNDPGSCDPSVYGEALLVCRQEEGELASHCHKPLPQSLCSLSR